MRKVIFQVNVSLDGYISGPRGEMDWFVWDDELGDQAADILQSSDLILLGRNLAEEFLDYWPTNTSDFGRMINNTPKIVFSQSLSYAPWPNVSIVRNDFVQTVNTLKRQHGQNIVLYGGAQLAQSFMQHGLIDEYHLFVNPLVMGGGLHLFGAMAGRLNLTLVRSKPTAAGAVMLCYRV